MAQNALLVVVSWHRLQIFWINRWTTPSSFLLPNNTKCEPLSHRLYCPDCWVMLMHLIRRGQQWLNTFLLSCFDLQITLQFSASIKILLNDNSLLNKWDWLKMFPLKNWLFSQMDSVQSLINVRELVISFMGLLNTENKIYLRMFSLRNGSLVEYMRTADPNLLLLSFTFSLNVHQQ